MTGAEGAARGPGRMIVLADDDMATPLRALRRSGMAR